MGKTQYKLTQDLIDRICFHIRSHNFVNTAYRTEGITDRVWGTWLQKAEEEPESVYGQLVDSVARAEADSERLLLSNLSEKQSLEILERRYRDNWGKKEGAGPTGGGTTVQIILPPNGRETPLAIDVTPDKKKLKP